MDKATAQITAGIASAAIDLLQLAAESSSAQLNYPLQPPFSNMTQEDWVASVELWLYHGRKLIANLPPRLCPACGSGENRVLFESYDGYPFAECDRCRSWFVPKQVDMGLFETFFVSCPEAGDLAARMLRGRLAESSEEADRQRIDSYLTDFVEIAATTASKPARYLDTGCGVGNSLLAARDQGMEAVGIESDETALWLARSRGCDVRHISEPLPVGEFDFISFWEALEHISDPLDILNRFASILRPEGLVGVTIPNLDSSIVRVMRGDCPYVYGGTTSPGHINLLSVSGVRILLERAGLSLLDADVQYSNNPIDLFAYLSGHSRGAADMLSKPRVAHVAFPKMAIEFLNSVWPAVNLIERILLTGPILKITACRKGSEGLFEHAIQKLRRRRAEQITAQAEELLSFSR